jgi:hypothetical protein
MSRCRRVREDGDFKRFNFPPLQRTAGLEHLEEIANDGEWVGADGTHHQADVDDVEIGVVFLRWGLEHVVGLERDVWGK